jgi:hypothetical protein
MLAAMCPAFGCGHVTLALMDSADLGLIWSGLEPAEALRFLSIRRMTDCAITHINLASSRHAAAQQIMLPLLRAASALESPVSPKRGFPLFRCRLSPPAP